MTAAHGVCLDSIESIYRAQFHRFLYVATAITGGAESAADAVQEAFASAVRQRHAYRGDGPLEGWLWRMVVNAARKQTREPSHVAGHAVDEERTGVPESNGRDRRDDVPWEVRALVAALPERQRLVLFLRYYADLDYDRIAAALAISPGTVGATLNHAHAALRPLLKEAFR
jgi:RNA polymerase sigma factor (sigma-70 family)